MSESNARLIGQFWVVWGKIHISCKSLDEYSKDNTDFVNSDNCIRYNVDREAAWSSILKNNEYPDKSCNYYPHGEIVFDISICKFKVLCSAKLKSDVSFQKRLIKLCKLNSWTQFVEV